MLRAAIIKLSSTGQYARQSFTVALLGDAVFLDTNLITVPLP